MNDQQLTEPWYQQRKYKFTSSSIYKLMTEPRSAAAKAAGELSETAKTYIMEKVAEELGGFIPEMSAKAMDWGIENEPLAKEWYCKKTGNLVEQCGFIEVHPFYGGSPDSKVVDHRMVMEGRKPEVGALEIKCPYNSVNHIWHCLIVDNDSLLKEAPEYFWQVQSHMICLKADWCDFVSFDPRIDHEVGMHIVRITRDPGACERLLGKIERAMEYKQYIRERLGVPELRIQK